VTAATVTAAPRLAAPAPTSVLAQTWYLTVPRLQVFVRQPAYLLITLIQPVIWLFLFGNLFHRVVELPGFGGSASYLDYLVPGVVVMSALSSNMWTGMSVLEEIERGTLNRFLIAPIRRLAIVTASIITQALATIVQSVIIVLLGWAGGAHYPGGVAGLLVLLVASVLLGTVFAALSNAIGMLARQRETIIGLNTFLLLPLTFLSAVFLPSSLMPGWMRHIAAANPVSWALQASRGALAERQDWHLVWTRGGGLLLLAVFCVWLSVRTFRTYQKAV
jgi:ABC-2 type transport system permease protein